MMETQSDLPLPAHQGDELRTNLLKGAEPAEANTNHTPTGYGLSIQAAGPTAPGNRPQGLQTVHHHNQHDHHHDHGPPRRLHQDSVTGDYYTDSTQVEHPTQWGPENQETTKRVTLRQSRRLPGWAWYILAKSLGVKLHAFDKPYVGTVVYVLMLSAAAVFIVTHTWYLVFDIVSKITNQTLLTGLVDIIGAIYWCSLGIYAHRLAGKLFSCQKFVDSVRMHTKTIFKISAGGVLVILGTTVIVINNYHVVEIFSLCDKVGVDPWVCRVMYVSRVIFSVFALVFNLLVGIVLLSVCRTHTIGIRRFIRELEEDGKICDHLKKMSLYGDAMSDVTDEEQYQWDDDDINQPTQPSNTDGATIHPPTTHAHTSSVQATPVRQRKHILLPGPSSNKSQTDRSPVSETAPAPVCEGATSLPPRTSVTIDQPPPTIVIKEESPAKPKDTNTCNNTACIEGEGASLASQNSMHNLAQFDLPVTRILRSPVDSSHLSTRAELSSPRKMPSSLAGMSEGTASVSNFTVDQRVLSNEDILFRFWKLQNKLTATSLSVQRWFILIILFILAWTLIYIISWLSHEAQILELAEFVLPLMILPLLSSAYAEVNYESTRTLKAVCPVEERLHILKHMREQPLEMMAFGFAINYSTIVTALGAVALAFSTRLIMDVVNVHHP